jgi:hypothetical protein
MRPAQAGRAAWRSAAGPPRTERAPPARPERAPEPEPERRDRPRDDGDRGGDRGGEGGGAGEAVAKVLGSPAFRAFARSAASALGREITRGILGNRSRRR